MANKGNALNRFKAKKKRLMKLYVLWHQTHQERVRREFHDVLHETLEINPYFRLREDFELTNS